MFPANMWRMWHLDSSTLKTYVLNPGVHHNFMMPSKIHKPIKDHFHIRDISSSVCLTLLDIQFSIQNDGGGLRLILF